MLELKPKLAKWRRVSELTALNSETVVKSLFENDEVPSENLSSIYEDLRSALENLGYKDKQIRPILKGFEGDDSIDDFNSALKSALRKLRSGPSTEMLR